MLPKFASRIVCCATLLSLAIAFTAAEQSASAADTPIKSALSKRGKAGRRLPTHYKTVVNEEQREQIYKIQEEYRPKIDALKTQLDALKKERDDKIAAVLTTEQKKQVEDAAAKAKEAKETKAVVPATPPVEPTPAK